MFCHRQGSKVVVCKAPNGEPLAHQRVEVQQQKHAFPFGIALGHRLLAEPGFEDFVLSRFNWAVFGNESKWYANEAEAGKETYAHADEMLDWCEANKLAVRGHCVFWEPEKWQPRWLAGLSTEELHGAVERRLEHAAEHFKGRFRHWDVNNELLHGRFFRDRLGDDIVPWMFKRLRELDPSVKLFVNDFNVLSVDQDFQEVETEAYVKQIRELLDQGVPIDGIGIQGHVWYEDILAHPQVIQERLDTVAQLGIPIWITEFDVDDKDPQRNADVLELVYRTAFGHPMIEGIMSWMLWERDSWRGPHMGLAEANWNPKPACERLDALLSEWTTEYEAVTDANGCVTVSGYAGDYTLFVGGTCLRATIEADRP